MILIAFLELVRQFPFFFYCLLIEVAKYRKVSLLFLEYGTLCLSTALDVGTQSPLLQLVINVIKMMT